MTARTEILIIGAGPVGLMAVVELTRRGFSPRIIEKDSGPHVESRALAINPRSLDILEPSGAAGRKSATTRKLEPQPGPALRFLRRRAGPGRGIGPRGAGEPQANHRRLGARRHGRSG